MEFKKKKKQKKKNKKKKKKEKKKKNHEIPQHASRCRGTLLFHSVSKRIYPCEKKTSLFKKKKKTKLDDQN